MKVPARPILSTIHFVCMNPGEGVIIQVLVDGDAVTLFDLLDPGLLEIGSRVEVFGDADTPPGVCDIVAEQIIVEPPSSL